MKVAYVLHGRFPTEKAHGIQVTKLCVALAERSSVVLITLGLGNSAQDARYGFALERMRIKQPLPRATRAGFLLEKGLFLFAAAKAARAGSFDRVITREPALLFLLPRQTTLLEIHNLPSNLWLYLPAMRRAKRVIVKTRALQDALMRAGIGGEHIEVIPNAVDPQDFAQMPDLLAARKALGLPEQPTAVYAGSFQPWKGVDTFMSAADKCPDVSFVIVGGTEKEIAQKRLHAAPNVRLVGAKPHEEAIRYLAAADVLVLPNERGTSVSELYTSPLKLFEYMAARRPILASDLPSIREVLADDQGCFFEPGNDADLAEKIGRMIANPEAAEARSRRAYQAVIGNTWGGYAARLLAM